MILLDTSVVVDHVRGRDAKLKSLIPTLPAAVCGVSRAELLCGARTPAERQALMTALGTYRQVPIPDALWDTVGDHLAALRAAGVTVPFPDVAIATVAIANGIELWARDRHFPLIQSILPALRLFQEPP
jgi:predicted nucleic acid-binding protein